MYAYIYNCIIVGQNLKILLRTKAEKASNQEMNIFVLRLSPPPLQSTEVFYSEKPKPQRQLTLQLRKKQK